VILFRIKTPLTTTGNYLLEVLQFESDGQAPDQTPSHPFWVAVAKTAMVSGAGGPSAAFAPIKKDGLFSGEFHQLNPWDDLYAEARQC
jgi:hypothetical protein